MVDPAKSLKPDPGIRAPHTDEYSAGVDRDMGHGLAFSIVYIGKHGRDFIGWNDTTGTYEQRDQPPLPDGRVIQAWVLTSPGERARVSVDQSSRTTS